MNEFTKGVWWSDYDEDGAKVYCGDEASNQTGKDIIYMNEHAGDAHLIATAGTTATKLAEQGYDAVKVLEALPGLLSIFDDRYLDVAKSIEVWEWLDKVRGEL